MTASAHAELSALRFFSLFRECRPEIISVAIFSALVNVLYLTGSLYMLQVYDRVIPSRSIPTLVALSLLAAMLYGFQASLDFCRIRILVRAARCLDEKLSPSVFRIVAHLPTSAPGAMPDLQPLRDLDQVRSFLSGGGPIGFLDLPWMPFYLGICFMFHPFIGIAASVGALILVVLTLCSEALTRGPVRTSAGLATMRIKIAESARRNAEVVAAMGMTNSIESLWSSINRKHLDAHIRASDVTSGFSGFSKTARMALQSGVLGVGAYLVIQDYASPGIIIAGSILAARALAPIEQVLAHWKGYVGARQSWTRLDKLLGSFPERNTTMSLRPPQSCLSVDKVSLVPPGGQRVVVRDISFSLQAGGAVGIIGPSGSGKSSLARALVGVWKPVSGSIRLDGATLDQWSPHFLGRHIGYLPQNIELLDGTIKQNISRFESDPDADAVIRAAERAGVHDMIVRLPNGYETRVGEDGLCLSGGQRQRVALARALYNDPFLLVLDEPNSNLDAYGEQALTSAISDVRARGSVVVIIAQRASALAGVDLILAMTDGVARAAGPKEEILRRVVHAVQR
ncbi:MAG TPA: type I secretion system permease/ATPase [Pseudolabrys sp.]|nr:type I secretion system permease/ATPase [Pseudolabrys sp.]